MYRHILLLGQTKKTSDHVRMGHTIAIHEIDEHTFTVTVTESGGEATTTHTVHVDERYLRSHGWDRQDTTTLIRESFEFLLAREPKEAILSEFDLRDIARYFPEYESDIVKQ